MAGKTRYPSLEELKKAATLPEDAVKKFHKMSCQDAYQSFISLFKQACDVSQDAQKQFILLGRALEIANLIINKNGFNDFTRSRKTDAVNLYKNFEAAIKKSTALLDLFQIEYGEAERNKKTVPEPISLAGGTPSQLPSSGINQVSVPGVSTPLTPLTPLADENAPPDKLPKCSISPKELIRRVEGSSPRLSAIIVDYRENRDSVIKYPNDKLISVVEVPNSALRSGLIFTSLKNQVDIANRALLTRLGQYDIVVFMDDNQVELTNCAPPPVSKPAFLMRALWEYNTECKPKRLPMFMEGGFNMWKVQYPIYTMQTNSKGPEQSSSDTDDLSRLIQNYMSSRESLSLPSYPDLDPKKQPLREQQQVEERKAEETVKADNRKITTFGVEDENAFSAKITYPTDQAAPSAFLARDPSQPNDATKPQRPMIFATAVPKPYPTNGNGTLPHIPPRPTSEELKAVPNEGRSINGRISPASGPMQNGAPVVDRKNKPAEPPSNGSGIYKGGTNSETSGTNGSSKGINYQKDDVSKHIHEPGRGPAAGNGNQRRRFHISTFGPGYCKSHFPPEMWDWLWKLPSWATCFLSGVDCERFGRHTHEHASTESNPPTGKEKDQDSPRRVSAAHYMQHKSSNETAHEKSNFVKPNPEIFSERIEEVKETTTKSSTSDAETLARIGSGLTEINWQRAYVACARWDGDETMKKSVRSHKASKKVELKEESSPDYDTVIKFRIKALEELSLEEEECKRKQLKPMAKKEINPDEIFVRHHNQLSAKSQSQKITNFDASPLYNPYKYIDEEPVSKEDVDVHTEIRKRMEPESPEIGVSIPFENQLTRFSRVSSGTDMKEDSMSSDTSEDGEACSRPKNKKYDDAPLAFHEQYFPRRALSEMSEEMEKHGSIEQARSPKSSMSQDSGSGNEAEEARIHQLMRKSLHTQVEEYLELRQAYEEKRYPPVPLPDRSSKPQQVVPPLSRQTKEALLAIYESMANRVRNNVAINTGKRTPGCTGLYNMGNTCFMNATLQALFHTPGFRDIFTRDVFLSKINEYNSFSTKGVISSVFSALMDIVWGGQLVAFKPDRFLQLFADQVNKTLADGHQHDASEFHLFLLDSLHEDMNRVINRKSFEQNYKGGEDIVSNADDYARNNRLFSSSPVYDVFNLQTVSELSCSSCGERSAKFEECSLISLELPVGQTSASLKDCLKAHFSQTNLEGDSRWNCPKCKKARNATRRTKIWTLPPVLVIHLKRFSLSNGEYVKNIMQVNFDAENLEFDRHLHEKAPRSAATNVPYQLYAVTNHRGSLNSGHYTATVHHAERNQWLKFDDETVSSTSVDSIDTSCAYLLYYKRKSVGTMTRM